MEVAGAHASASQGREFLADVPLSACFPVFSAFFFQFGRRSGSFRTKPLALLGGAAVAFRQLRGSGASREFDSTAFFHLLLFFICIMNTDLIHLFPILFHHHEFRAHRVKGFSSTSWQIRREGKCCTQVASTGHASRSAAAAAGETVRRR